MDRLEMFKEDQGLKYSIRPEEFDIDGLTYRHIPDLDGRPYIYKTRVFNRSFISGGKESLKMVRENDQIELELVDEHPHYLFLKDKFSTIKLSDDYEIKDIDPENHTAIQEFIDLNSEDDIDDAEIYLDDPDERIKMIYFQNKPVAYAAYRRYKNNTGDVGILVHPDHRKKGLGLYAVNEITKLAIKNSILPMYRTSIENPGSMAIAKKCGYEELWRINVYKLL